MVSRSILGVFAHPDDECMGPGGTLAKYARDGHRVAFVTATDGGAGRLFDERPEDNTELRRRRRAETSASADILGIESLGFFGWDDGELDERNILDVEHEIVRVLREWRPDVLVTFHGSGISYHPDHRVMWLALSGAFHGAARAGWYRDERLVALEPWQPRALYAYGVRRPPMEAVDWPRDVYACDDDEITTRIDTSSVADVRWRAIEAHESQSGGPPFRDLYEAGAFDEEVFVRTAAWPVGTPISRGSSCLFDRLFDDA